MKEIPILFSTPMVQAILEGRKSQTRRILKDKHVLYSLDVNKVIPEYFKDGDGGWCPYGQPGDVLWVRESWGVGSRSDPFQGSVDGIEFKADSKFIDDIESLPLHSFENFDYGNYDKSGWRPSIHMPKAIARIWLQVESVRVERLQDICQHDAGEEGVEYFNVDWDAFEGGELLADYTNYTWRDDPTYEDYHFPTFANPVDSFRTLWQSINGAESWQANPWVWAIQFKVLSTTGKPTLTQP